MAYEAQVNIRQGEIEPIFGQISAQTGDTITLQLTPTAPYAAPSFALLSSAGALVSGFPIAIPSGNFTAGANATILFWGVLDTTNLAPGAYVARLSAAVLSTADGIVRQRISEVQISLLSGVEVGATYDPTTSLGQSRLYALDTDPANAIFSDTEWTQFLTDSGGVTLLAAALALEVLATDKLRIANAIRIGAYKNTSGSIYSALVERAARLRALAICTPVVNSPDQMFSTTSDGGLTPGTTTLW